MCHKNNKNKRNSTSTMNKWPKQNENNQIITTTIAISAMTKRGVRSSDESSMICHNGGGHRCLGTKCYRNSSSAELNSAPLRSVQFSSVRFGVTADPLLLRLLSLLPSALPLLFVFVAVIFYYHYVFLCN